MNRSVVLDASAVTAFLQAEPGAELVATLLSAALISTVNWAEVVQTTVKTGRATPDLRARFRSLGTRIIPLEVATAERAAVMQSLSRPRGLSLADRVCLALAYELSATAYTADTAWSTLDLDVQVKQIR